MEARVVKLAALKREVGVGVMDVDDIHDEEKFFKSKHNLRFLLALDEDVSLDK